MTLPSQAASTLRATIDGDGKCRGEPRLVTTLLVATLLAASAGCAERAEVPGSQAFTAAAVTSEFTEAGDGSARGATAATKLHASLVASPVAALLPQNPALWANAHVTTGPTFLAISMPIPAATLYLEANTVAEDAGDVVLSDLPPPPTFTAPRVYENERIWQADWVDNARVAWSLHLECADTVADLRCQDGTEVLRLQQSLRLVTGLPHAPGSRPTPQTLPSADGVLR
jgi:hypothetical protein